MTSTLRVLFIAAEADPLVKIGGLGDVAGSLPRALRSLSVGEGAEGIEVDVRLVIPFHGAVQRQAYPLRSLVRFDIPYRDGLTQAEVSTIDLDGLPVYVIAGPLIPPTAPVYTPNMGVDGVKFTFFSLAALELARVLNWTPHLVHANDWHTAPAIYALSRMRSTDEFYRHTASVLGLHNLPYLGIGAGPALAAFGLPPAVDSALPWWAQNAPLPLGLLSADHIVAVSPTYAREILTQEFGSGLQDFLQTRADHISGILNGLDVERWNPQADKALVVNFGLKNLAARVKNKAALQAELDLPQATGIPLLATISRMDHQKGIDLLPEALRMLDKGQKGAVTPWQLVILGTGDPTLEAAARSLETEFPGQVRAAVRFDAALSHRIYAGADMLLIPSRYEPCGLTQMIAMHYGCVPVARATGGLRDTVSDYDLSSDSTGFLFEQASSEALATAIGCALRVYANRKAWQSLQRRGMQRDFSWARFAQQYLELYLSILGTRTSALL